MSATHGPPNKPMKLTEPSAPAAHRRGVSRRRRPGRREPLGETPRHDAPAPCGRHVRQFREHSEFMEARQGPEMEQRGAESASGKRQRHSRTLAHG